MPTFSSLWNLKTLTGMAYLSLPPSRPDAALAVQVEVYGKRTHTDATLIFSLTTPRATKDQWLTR